MVGAKETFRQFRLAVLQDHLSDLKISAEKFATETLELAVSMIVLGKDRNLLTDIVLNFMEFFIEESCGSCTTCRIVPKLMKDRLVKILDGKGVASDITDLEDWAKLPPVSRCGLGQTAANPIDN